MGVDNGSGSGYNDQAVFSREQICGCAGTGRQASLRCWCRIDVWVQVPSAAPTSLQKTQHHARVVELADSLDSGSSVLYGRAGSSPASRTKRSLPGNTFPGRFLPPSPRQGHNCIRCARVVELADSLDSGSSVLYGRAGSSPASRTKKKHAAGVFLFGAQRSASRTAPPLAGAY